MYFDLTSDHRFSSTMLFLRGFVRAIVASYFSALLRCWETLDSTLESRLGSRANLSVLAISAIPLICSCCGIDGGKEEEEGNVSPSEGEGCF